MKRKFMITLFIIIILLNLAIASNVFAADISGSNSFLHSGYSTNFGIKSWRVYEYYIGSSTDGYEAGQSYKMAYNHDFLSDTPTIYSPEIGEGVNTLLSLKLLNSSGSVVSSTSNFSNGLIRSYFLNGDYYYYYEKCSYTALQGYPTGNYRIEWDTYFFNDNFIFSDSGNTSYTSYF